MNFLKIKLLVIAVVMFAASSAFASYTFDIDVNTHSMNGVTGFIDLTMNSQDIKIATATTQSFSSDASFIGTPIYTADASGLLADNSARISTSLSGQTSDYFHQVTFGDKIHFQLTLDSAPNNTFALAFYNADQSAALFTTDSFSGSAVQFNMTDAGVEVVNTSLETQVTPTPIPAAFWLLGSGLAGFAGLKRRKQK